MLTQKEITFLNFLYKKFNGEKLELDDIQKFIEERIKLPKDKSYELAYLYYHNFEEANGNFSNVTEPKRESFEEYKERVPWQIKAVMSITDDDDPDEYEFDDNDEVEYEGTTYKIFQNYDDLISVAENSSFIDELCRDSDPSPEYIYITDTDRRIIAGEEADNRVENMEDDDIISEMDLEDTLEELESYNEKKEKLKELEDELASEEDEEEINRIQSEIDEIESEIEHIGVTQTREEIIESAKEELRSTYYDQIYDELSDPVQYFIEDHGYYGNLSELIESGPVQYDCDQYKEDYISNADTADLVFATGYSEWDEVETEEHGYVYVVWY